MTDIKIAHEILMRKCQRALHNDVHAQLDYRFWTRNNAIGVKVMGTIDTMWLLNDGFQPIRCIMFNSKASPARILPVECVVNEILKQAERTDVFVGMYLMRKVLSKGTNLEQLLVEHDMQV